MFIRPNVVNARATRSARGGVTMPYSSYSPKQKKLAAVRPPRKKITRADLKALQKRRKTKKGAVRKYATSKKNKEA